MILSAASSNTPNHAWRRSRYAAGKAEAKREPSRANAYDLETDDLISNCKRAASHILTHLKNTE